MPFRVPSTCTCDPARVKLNEPLTDAPVGVVPLVKVPPPLSVAQLPPLLAVKVAPMPLQVPLMAASGLTQVIVVDVNLPPPLPCEVVIAWLVRTWPLLTAQAAGPAALAETAPRVVAPTMNIVATPARPSVSFFLLIMQFPP